MKTIGTSLIMLLTLTANCLAQESNEIANPQTSDGHVAVENNDAQSLELIAIFNDAMDAPTKYNAYVNPYLEMDGFPQKGEASRTEYNKMLLNWIESNPEKINQLLMDRQVAHDELYGPRKKD